MINRKIKTLASLSFEKNYLDIKRVNKISKDLSRRELKEYIKFIKQIEKKRKVVAFVANLSQKKTLEKDMKRIFLDKKIEIVEDKSLIAGLRIIDNDNVYDFNIKNTLENITSFINQ